MGLDGVNGKNTKTVYDYENLDLSKAKNEKEVANSIIDLANTAQANFDSMKATVDDYGNEIDSQERMEIAFNWLPIIGNAVRKIPSNLRSACTEAINKLKQVMINIAKDMNAASLEDANTGVKVRIDKDGNGTVTFAEDDKNTAYEPQATDSGSSYSTGGESIKDLARKYVQERKKIDPGNFKALIDLREKYTEDFEGDLLLYFNRCVEEYENAELSSTVHAKIYTESYGNAMIEVVSSGYRERIAENDAQAKK